MLSSVSSCSVNQPANPDLVFVNPSAGGGRARDALPLLQAYAIRARWNVQFRVTSSAEDLSEQARAAATAGFGRMFILGGDGSFQVLVNALTDFPEIVLGVLPAGCGNDLAASLGLPKDPMRAAELLREAGVCAIDAIRVKPSNGKTRLFTGGGGVGLDAETSHVAATRFRNLPGRLRYLLSAAVAFAKYRATHVRIEMVASDGESLELATEVLLLAILNTPSYGAGLKFAPEARIDDGVLDLVLVEDLPFVELLQALPRLILRGEVRSERVKRFLVRRLKVQSGAPCRFHGDGEILGHTPLEIEIVPRAIRVLRP
jgi:diacylglycerol kinase (ATP)